MIVGLYLRGRKVAQMAMDESQRVTTTLLAPEFDMQLQRLLYHGLVAGGKLVLDVDGPLFMEAALDRLQQDDGWKAVRED